MKQNRKVILIMTDTQRHDMVSCYGNKNMRTPCIDQLAEEGIRFQNAYTTQPVCQPARAGIFTGQFPHSVNGWTNSMALCDNTHTIGERLQDNGIHTAYVGKWHLDGGDYFGLGKAPKGWDKDYWYDMRNYIDELTPEERVQSRNEHSMDTIDFPAEFTFAHRVSNRAVDFLEKFNQDDFFLTVSYDEPHQPFLCPREYWEPFENYEFPKYPNVYDTLENKPDYQKAWAGDMLNEDKEAIKIKEKYFFGCNSFVDNEIGRVLDAIKKYAPDAVVIYTSDHGDFMHSHSLNLKGPASYEEITHIPFIVKGADIPQKQVNEHIVSHINIAPTIFDIMGVKKPELFEGKGIIPELKENPEQVNDCVYMEFGRYEIDHDGFGGLQLMRTGFDGRYKLAINLLSTDELYDLKNDPYEMVNLIDCEDTKTVRDELHNKILDNMNNTRDPFRGYYWETRPWRKDACKPSWGYTGMTRQRVDSAYERVQLDYANGLEIKEAVRKK